MSNMDLRPILAAHRDRAEKDKDAIMTLVSSGSGSNTTSGSSTSSSSGGSSIGSDGGSNSGGNDIGRWLISSTAGATVTAATAAARFLTQVHLRPCPAAAARHARVTSWFHIF